MCAKSEVFFSFCSTAVATLCTSEVVLCVSLLHFFHFKRSSREMTPGIQFLTGPV